MSRLQESQPPPTSPARALRFSSEPEISGDEDPIDDEDSISVSSGPPELTDSSWESDSEEEDLHTDDPPVGSAVGAEEQSLTVCSQTNPTPADAELAPPAQTPEVFIDLTGCSSPEPALDPVPPPVKIEEVDLSRPSSPVSASSFHGEVRPRSPSFDLGGGGTTSASPIGDEGSLVSPRQSVPKSQSSLSKRARVYPPPTSGPMTSSLREASEGEPLLDDILSQAPRMAVLRVLQGLGSASSGRRAAMMAEASREDVSGTRLHFIAVSLLKDLPIDEVLQQLQDATEPAGQVVCLPQVDGANAEESAYCLDQEVPEHVPPLGATAAVIHTGESAGDSRVQLGRLVHSAAGESRVQLGRLVNPSGKTDHSPYTPVVLGLTKQQLDERLAGYRVNGDLPTRCIHALNPFTR